MRSTFRSSRTTANLLILLATLIWGSAFVAQRVSLDHVPPLLFTGIRFVLGGTVVALVIALRALGRRASHLASASPSPGWGCARLWGAALVLGSLLVGAIGSQQIGLASTSVANAGFISSLYVVFVPILGLFVGHRLARPVMLGALLAMAGLYALSGPVGTWRSGDLWELLGVVIVSGQIVAMGRFAPRFEPMALASAQFLVCGVEGLALSLLLEHPSWTTAAQDLLAAWGPVLYGGIFSVGVAYTIQVVAQRHARAADAALLFSLEGVVAALAAWLILGESLSSRGLLGCVLVFAGLVVAQRPERDPPASSISWDPGVPAAVGADDRPTHLDLRSGPFS